MHLGIIMDGNRRWAKQHGLSVMAGHEAGVRKVEEIISWCPDLGIKELTVYAFSTENFKRSPDEVGHLMNLFRKKFADFSKDERLKDLRIRVIGRISLLPADLQKRIAELVEKTRGNVKKGTVNFALGYGGRTEILDMVRKVARQVKDGKLDAEDIDEKVVAENLYMVDEPDLIIRTGGAMRTSNFLPWQGAYSEWAFMDKMWPEISKEDVAKAIEDFKARERRFGR
ncbi:MAG: polyprenyl diphosphate synthase [Nanoarchaeota archaeon]